MVHPLFTFIVPVNLSLNGALLPRFTQFCDLQNFVLLKPKTANLKWLKAPSH